MRHPPRSITLSIALARVSAAMCLALLLLPLSTSRATPSEYFAIHVVDDATGRGVPLVELSTVNHASFWTDSNGLVAFNEPGLMDQEVFFHVTSYGYEYPKDGFDNRGVKLKIKPGGSSEIKIKRLNIAERLYRITGAGIYRDTVLLGRHPPTKLPVLSGQVLGQDTVIATPYRGKIYWFYGDTDRPSYPLGNFGASGATSELPGHGGLDPAVGIDLTYFVDKNGFSKPMCPDFGPGLQWIESLMTVPDEHGRERLLARVTSASGIAKANGWHLAIFNDENQIFESIVRWDIHESHNVANPFRARVGGEEYYYLYPDYRVKVDFRSLTNLAAYETFTCLAPGSGPEDAGARIERGLDGKPRYQWRKGLARIDGSGVRQLLRAGLLKPEETWKQPHDAENGKPIQLGRGSVSWNEYRKRWVMIASGLPGEVWFSEGDTPLGPWVYARRVVSHEHYNFYNPTQDRFFDQEGGRLIYFEGTYTASFSDAKAKTPRYDYNQIMYRLDLDDARLTLPAPVYNVHQPRGNSTWMMREQIEPAKAWAQVESVAFFAIPPQRRNDRLIPIYSVTTNGISTLQAGPVRGQAPNTHPVFLALAAKDSSGTTGAANEFNSPAVVFLYEYRQTGTDARLYSIEPEPTRPGWVRSPEPLCRVWRNPMAALVLDTPAIPVLSPLR